MPFNVLKFRSMTVDAEKNGVQFAKKKDNRITRIGSFIRKTRIDELPQLFNVLKGEMSLVGTRPPTPQEVAQYEDHHFRRISIKPGLTGMWQVSGRNQVTDFDEVVALDTRYINQWNLWLDIRIILRTILVVFAPGRGGTI